MFYILSRLFVQVRNNRNSVEAGTYMSYVHFEAFFPYTIAATLP